MCVKRVAIEAPGSWLVRQERTLWGAGFAAVHAWIRLAGTCALAIAGASGNMGTAGAAATSQASDKSRGLTTSISIADAPSSAWIFGKGRLECKEQPQGRNYKICVCMNSKDAL